VSEASSRQRRSANINDDSGVTIDVVEKNSPASDVLMVGDIITRVNDQLISATDEFVRTIGQMPLSRPTRLTIRRAGRPMTLTIQLRRRDLPSVAVNRDNQRLRWRGMLLGPIPANWDFGAMNRPPHGLMVLGIEPGSPMVRQGVRSGTVITSVAGRPVDAVAELQSILDATPAEQCSLEIVPQSRDAATVSGK